MAQARPLWDDHRQPAGLTRSRGAVRARWRQGDGLVAAGVLACLIVAGLVVRLWVLGTGDELNADEVLPGLMAWHILTRGERPVFYYGQHYFGAVEAYILAGLFAWRGFDPWLAVVSPLACSLALIPITYALARHLTGRGGSVVATLAVAIPPPVLAKLYANPGGGFSLAFALHGAALLCFLRAYLSTGAGWPSTLWAMAFSFVAGILCWVWQPALVLYPALVLMLVLRGPAWRRPGRLVGVVAPVLCGLIPPLSYNISAGWPTVGQLAAKYATLGSEAAPGIGHGLHGLWTLLLIAFGGGNEAEGGTNFLQSALVAMSFPLTWLSLRGPLAGRTEQRPPPPAPPTGGDLRARRLAAAVLTLAALLDLLAAHSTVRHLAPVAHLGYVFTGAALAFLARRLVPARVATLRPLAVAVAGTGLIVLPNLWLDAHAADIFRRFVPGVRDVRAAVVALQERQLSTGYADYWTAYPVTYFSGERIVLAPSMATIWGERVDRYPDYTHLVDAVDDPGALFLLLDGRCSALAYLLPLEQQDATYRLERVGRWHLLWDIHPPAGAESETLQQWRRVLTSRRHC